jgi:type IX secretion system PorP/SprF family membrane protein
MKVHRSNIEANNKDRDPAIHVVLRTRLYLLIMAIVSGSGPIAAQDIHFSQFFNTPLALGPGSIGAFDGEQRLSAVFRQQWRSVTIPYRTFGLGGDLAHAAGVKGLGLGAWLYNDRAGDSRLNRFHFSLGGSWTVRPAGTTDHAVTFGLQAGISSITLNEAGLSFDAQYNGFTYDPQLGSGENIARDGLVHPDVHFGAVYRYTPTPRGSVQFGVSLFNLTSPRIGFLGEPGEPLDRRASVHIITGFPLSSDLDLRPMAQFMAQGTFHELDLGANLRYILLQRYGLERSLIAGLHYRAADAGYVHAGLEYDDWTVGISYDINTSKLVPASRERGGIEFTLVRLVRKRNTLPVRFKACPEQL